jgi:hypothetical protein
MTLLRLLTALLISSATWSAQACTTDADCDDHNVCNGAETCQAGVCIAGVPISCNDNNPCTIDTCDPVAGCTFTPANGCLLSGKLLRIQTGKLPRMTVQTGQDMVGLAFPANNTADDPVVNAATLRVFSAGNFDATYPMPTSNWSYLGAPGANGGYVYSDKANVHGPITLCAIRPGRKNKIKGRGPGLIFSLAMDPDPVQVVLHFGLSGRQYCLTFGGRPDFLPGARFTAMAAPPPAACP